jgi:DNA-binding MurR/RpiR family transcriptional regulator
MAPLIRIRSERDRMSAIERRIADYLLENAHLLRDYSSQRLADALGISQSSVVKFSQKLGFKGYPDLKLSVAQALARSTGSDEARELPSPSDEPHALRAEHLWRCKAAAEEETRSINPHDTLETIAAALHGAGRVFLCGIGEDGLRADAFAFKLSQLGILALSQRDPVLMATTLTLAAPDDVLLLFCEHGRQPELTHLIHPFRAAQGTVVSVTRHSANPLRALADAALLVSAHHERAEIEPLLYQAALQQLLDQLLVGICEHGPQRLSHLRAGSEPQHGAADS